MNLGMISNYVKAKWSKGLTERKVEVNTKDIRLLSCFGNGDDIPVCPGLRPSDRKMGKFYCGECGCGDKASTWLNGTEEEYTKLDHPYLSCPRRMPGFSDYEPANKNTEDFGEKRKLVIEVTLGGDVLSDKNLIKPEMSEEEKKQQNVRERGKNKEAGCPNCQVKATVRNDIIEKLRRDRGLEPDFKNPEYNNLFSQLFNSDDRIVEINNQTQEGNTKSSGCSSCAAKKKLREEIRAELSVQYSGDELENKIKEEFNKRMKSS